MSTTRVCLWSGPRNVSTAVMYSFAQRPDTRVVDEPLYAHYLRVSGVDHPGRDAVLAAQDPDGEAVVRDVVLGACDRPVLFCKQMAHHLRELERGFLDDVENVLLVRDPREVLLSFQRVVPDPGIDDVGIALQNRLLTDLTARGRPPLVLDSKRLLLDPPGVLARLCEALGIRFDAAMLTWEAGARPEDGVWAPHWYDSVHRSTGFAPWHERIERLPADLEPVLEECRPHYAALLAAAL